MEPLLLATDVEKVLEYLTYTTYISEETMASLRLLYTPEMLEVIPGELYTHD